MIRWAGTVLQMVGALALASHRIDPFWAYFVMLPGAILLLAVYAYRYDGAQVALQGTFTAINAFGIWSWGA